MGDERSGGISRRQLLQGAAGLGLTLAGSSLVAECGEPASPAGDPSPARVYRIGWLAVGPPLRMSSPIIWQPGAPVPTLRRFIERLAELGYVEGQTLHWELRIAPDPDELATAAAELVALPVDVFIVFSSVQALRAAFAAPGNTPIVSCASTNDPVGEGYAQSLARPGGKVTGVIYVTAPGAFGPKRLEVLKETLPSLSRLGVLFDLGIEGGTTVEASLAGSFGQTARELGIELIYEELRDQEELYGACAALARAGAEAVYPSTRAAWTGVDVMARLSEEALAQGLPILGLNRLSAQAGALVGYGPDALAVWARAAEYVDKVLRGARPADLPFENAERYELVINACTAGKLGLTIPPAVLVRATEVIPCP
jgi:putative ABC transport system substrate-binding protein